MYTITTATGREHPVTMCGAADGRLHIRLEDGYSFTAVVREFSNEENTSIITYHYGEMETRHEDYTALEMVQWESGTCFHITLKRQTEVVL